MLNEKAEYLFPQNCTGSAGREAEIMQLNLATDYAIPSILYIAGNDSIVRLEDVVMTIGTPLPYVKKMLYRLTKVGLVCFASILQ